MKLFSTNESRPIIATSICVALVPLPSAVVSKGEGSKKNLINSSGFKTIFSFFFVVFFFKTTSSISVEELINFEKVFFGGA